MVDRRSCWDPTIHNSLVHMFPHKYVLSLRSAETDGLGPGVTLEGIAVL